jgi:hypothetical protein
MSILSLVKGECSNLVGGICRRLELSGKRFKKEVYTTIIYQYPYELVYENSGDCRIIENKPCNYFKKYILPSAPELSEEYREIESSLQVKETKRCNCGNKIDSNERKCITCKASTRRLRNRRFRRDG